MTSTAPDLLEISLIVPAWREVRRLSGSLSALKGWLEDSGLSHEVILVVEQSDDGTLDLARRQAGGWRNWVVVDNGPHRGKGHAVRSGMLRARGAHVFYLDADLSTDLAEIRHFLNEFSRDSSVQILIANRLHADSVLPVDQPCHRRLATWLFNRVIRILFGIQHDDTQCGFKAFRHSAVTPIFSRQRLAGFAFDVEVLLLARQLGQVVRELPVRWTDRRGSTLCWGRDALRVLCDLLRMAVRGPGRSGPEWSGLRSANPGRHIPNDNPG